MLTKRQQEVLDVFLATGSKQATARQLKINKATVSDALRAIENKGCAPWLESVPKPPTMDLTNTTVHYKDGQVVQEWRRLSPTVQQMHDVVSGLCERLQGKGRAAKRTPRKTDTDELLFELCIYDAHVGMFADEKETLDKNYDCDIATKAMLQVAEDLASRARRPKKAVVTFGGDMLHSDSRNNRTELSGHVLDVDTRYQRVVEYIIAACRDVVQIMAKVADEVEIVILEGNHSWHSEVWLARVLEAYYHACPNINVLIARSPRKSMVFGDNLLIWSHGDRIAPDKWAKIIPAEFAKEWGATKHRHLKMGHIHHKKTIAPIMIEEQAGLLVEYVEALCPSDAWHSGAGFIGSQKGASAFEYHRKHGLITRHFTPTFKD